MPFKSKKYRMIKEAIRKSSRGIQSVLLLLFDTVVLKFFSVFPLKSGMLLIRVDSIGDFVLWLPSAKAIRHIYQNRKITLLGNKIWIQLAKNENYWDEIWELDRKRFTSNPIYRFKLLRKIKMAGFDTVLHPVYSREFMLGDSIVRASCARERIGSTGDHSNVRPWQKRMSNRWYTHLIPSDSRSMMELKRNSEFIRGLGLRNSQSKMPSLRKKLKLTNQANHEHPYYILFPGASRIIKQWPLDNFATIAEYIYSQTLWQGLICGGPGEESLGEKLCSLSRVPLENKIGKTSLPAFANLTADAKLLIGNDTGAVHIAAAVGTLAICILGGGHYGRFMPYDLDIPAHSPVPIAITYPMKCFGCNWQCVFSVPRGKALPCILNITVEAVLRQVQPILKAQKRISMAKMKPREI